MENWTIDKSRDLYRVVDWGAGYFDINQKGHVAVTPDRNGKSIDMYDLMHSLKRRGIEAPILFRFDGIIRDRTAQIQEAFQNSIDQWGYNGVYRITYPVKVNPQRHVVDTVRKAGHLRNIGLEVGSKPELLAVLAIHDLPDAPLLCNGYKDYEYVEIALLGRKLGRRSIIIIEQFYELEMILEVAERLGIEPEVGIRMKPITKGSGFWSNSSGDQAKFGLNTQEILTAVELLVKKNKSHWLKLLHFHVGSQIPAINSLKKVLKEATRMYTELHRICPSLELLDIGGGLGVDYDGSKTNFESSMNYSISEYAEAVVSALYEACEKSKIPHPDIISESGRAIAAHHAVLVAEVIDISPSLYGNLSDIPKDTCHPQIQRMFELFHDVNAKNCLEVLNDATQTKEEVFEQFIQGEVSLENRAYAELIFRHLVYKLNILSKQLKYVPEDIEKLDSVLRDTFFCNFSLFQSVLDSWAIDQLFPIMPIQNLNTEPDKKAVLADLTCDSDGEISRFIDLKDVKDYLFCHQPKEDELYYIGIFLVGAYQEILGGLHNLFGDTNVVHVNIQENGEVELKEVVRGDAIKEVLDYVEYDVEELHESLRQSLERAISKGTLTPEESAKIQRRYSIALDGYTYLIK
jgi:arginine decarboxylase